MDRLDGEISDALIIAYLNGEDLPDKQQELIAQWLIKPANKTAAQEAFEAWELSMLAKEIPDDIDTHWKKINNIIDKRERKSQNQESKLKWWWAAASVLLISGFMYFSYFKSDIQPIQITDLKTEHVKQKFVLPDESNVILNKNTKLSFEDNKEGYFTSARTVKLEGNAYFEVTSNKEEPFVIRTYDAEIEVLGTKFYVSTNKTSGTKVSVVEGSVKVQYLESNKLFILNANEKIDVTQNDVSKAVSNDFFWNTRVLVFKNDPLKKVFDQLSENYGVVFLLENETIGACPLTSKFEDLDLEEILEILSNIYELKFVKTSDKLNVVGNVCN